jgi:HEAT repeat protein
MRSSRFSRRRRAALGLVAALGAGAAEAAPLFANADTSTMVVRGKVERITVYPSAKLQVFRVRVARVVKGEVAVGETLDLAQEMLFPSTKPYFAEGTETLVFAIPLPAYSSFVAVLPAGRYWRWTDRLETAADVAALTDPALTDAVARYVAVRDDAEASADFLVGALTGPSPRIRQEALQVIAARREIPPLLDAGRLAPLRAWLDDTSASPVERSAVLVQLARRKASGTADVARGFADAAGPLQPAAIDALITVGEPPPVARLVALSQSQEEPLRLVASRGLAANGSPEAVARLDEILSGDASINVRLAVIQAFDGSDARVTELLARELARPERDVVMAAADGLVRQGSPEAVAVLAKTLEHGSEHAQMASAFALKRLNRPETVEILESLEQSSPDPNVRRLCRLALGESMHEH